MCGVGFFGVVFFQWGWGHMSACLCICREAWGGGGGLLSVGFAGFLPA